MLYPRRGAGQFTGLKKDHAKVALDYNLGLPDSRPILHLIGDGNYGVYESVIDCEIIETNLNKIIRTLGARKESALGCKNLVMLAYDLRVDDKEFVMQEFKEMGTPLSDGGWDERF